MQMPIINDPEFWTIQREPWQDAFKRKEASIQFPCDSAVKNLPAIQETWVWSPGWEDSLEKGNATHSSILVWRIQTQSMGSQRVRHDWNDLALKWTGRDTRVLSSSTWRLSQKALYKLEQVEPTVVESLSLDFPAPRTARKMCSLSHPVYVWYFNNQAD